MGSRGVWLSRTGIVGLLGIDFGEALGGIFSLSRGGRGEMQFSVTQDRLCMVKSHILREVTLSR